MNRVWVCFGSVKMSSPHASGDEPASNDTDMNITTLSPREWG